MAVLVCFPVASRGQEGSDGKAEPAGMEVATAEIRDAVQSYVAAFNARNVDSLSKMWTPDGVFTLRSSNEQVRGRAAIAEQFKQILGDQKSAPKLAAETESVEFISPNVAMERGKAMS